MTAKMPSYSQLNWIAQSSSYGKIQTTKGQPIYSVHRQTHILKTYRLFLTMCPHQTNTKGNHYDINWA